jgi:hypothetical protein
MSKARYLANVVTSTGAISTDALSTVIDGAPSNLNTLNELAAAINDDPSYYTTLNTALSGKVPTSTTLTINGVSYSLDANRTWTVDALPSQIGNSGKYLTTNGTVASWTENSAVASFSAGTTGLTPSTASSGAIVLAGTLNVASGGTNVTTYTTGDILYASATNTLSKLAIGTNGYVLTSNGTIPSWADIPDQPVINSVTPSSFGGAAGTSFTITGTGFHSGATVTFVGSDNTLFVASTTTFDSPTQLTAVTPAAFPISKSPYSITVTQLSGATTTRTALITSGTAPSWTTSSGSIGTFSETASVSVNVVATDPDGGAITYSLISGSLPSGLSLNTSTGNISGTAPLQTVDTTYSFTIRATDVGTNSSDRAFNITILDNIPPSWVTSAGSLGTVWDLSRTGASFTVQATDTQTVTYSVASGSLPAGMSLNSSTGVISGTPNAVASDTTSNFVISASDGSLSDSRSFSITVKAPSSTLYTSGSGTYTTSSGQTTIKATVSGGGGGGSTTSCGGQRYAAGGGGGAAQKTYSGLTPVGGQSYSYSVGAGGTGYNYGGACEPPGGGVGGTSSFGTISGGGGGGGRSGVPGNGYTEVGGSGGSGSGGDVNQTGGNGGAGSGGAVGTRTALAAAVGSYSQGGANSGGTGQGGFVRIEA